MPTFAARYLYRTDDAALLEKDRLRPGHGAFVRSLLEEGSLLLAGVWGPEDPAGGSIVFSAPDRATAEATISADPYVRAGILADLAITEWNATLGSLAPHLPR